MSMVMFTVLYPDLGAAETRCIIVQSGGRWRRRREEEEEEFALIELYCAEPGCDCRRVMFNVISKRLDRHVATISHGFEAPGEKSAVPEQTYLDPLNRQSDLSEELLDIFTRRALCAFVTVKAGITTDDALKQELKAWVTKEIGAIARPDDVRFTETLPKTRSGKIMRRLLRDIAAGKQAVGDTSTLEDYSVLAKLREDQE